MLVIKKKLLIQRQIGKKASSVMMEKWLEKKTQGANVIYQGKKDCQKYGRDAISDLEINKS